MSVNSVSRNYRTTPELMMAAFDRLPPRARRALADAVENWVAQTSHTLSRRQNRRGGHRPERTVGADGARSLVFALGGEFLPVPAPDARPTSCAPSSEATQNTALNSTLPARQGAPALGDALFVSPASE